MPHTDPWAFELDPGLLVILAVAVAGYVGALRWAAPTHAPRPEAPVSRRQVTCFGLGVASLWLALGWPLHGVGEELLFSAHMVQHMLVAYVAAPLLLLGTPGWMLRLLLGRGGTFAAARLLTRPLLAFVLFNLVFVLIHWPAFVDLSLREPLVHAAAMHGTLAVISLVVWIPLVSPLPELPRLPPPVNLLYLFGQSILPTVPASFLTFGEGALYDAYAAAPRLWGISVIADQQVAGVIMKVGGGFLLWGMITVLFFVWQAEEERRNRRPVDLDVEELELELAGLGGGGGLGDGSRWARGRPPRAS